MLYNIDPVGLNTDMIESETSYISRLAEAHSVSVGILLGKEIAPVLGKDYFVNSSKHGGSRIYDYSYEINGFGELAFAFSRGLEALTGCKTLNQLTLLTLHDFLSTRELLRHHRAWCPVCYEQWKKDSLPIYEPLLWNFKSVNICGIHNVSLQSHCPNCKRTIPIMSRNSRNGYCSYCGCWLGLSDVYATNTVDTGLLSWNSFVVSSIEYLLVKKNEATFQLPQNCIKAFLMVVMDDVGGICAFSRYFGIPKSTAKYWHDGMHKPSLEKLLRILYRLDIPLSDIIEPKPFKRTFAIFKSINLGENQIDQAPKRRFFDWDKVEEKLNTITNIVPPPSVQQVALMIGCDKKLLYTHFPSLTKQLSKNHSRYIISTKNKRITLDEQKIVEATIALYNSGLYPSRRKVEEYLSSEIVLHDNNYQQAWKETLQKLSML